MSDTDKDQDQAQDQAPAKKGKKQQLPPSKYVTTDVHSYPFDIQVRGEVIQGQWTRTEKKVEFLVPADLVEGFEMHYHFVSGNLVKANDE